MATANLIWRGDRHAFSTKGSLLPSTSDTVPEDRSSLALFTVSRKYHNRKILENQDKEHFMIAGNM